MKNIRVLFKRLLGYVIQERGAAFRIAKRAGCLRSIYVGLVTLLPLLAWASQRAEIISVKQLAREERNVQYTKINSKIKLSLPIFPIASSKHSTWNEPILPETFILTIPHGRVYSNHGLVLHDNRLISELIWPWSILKKHPETLTLPPSSTLKKVVGAVAVLAQEGHDNYYHWITEIIPKLALIEQRHLHYDYIYVPELQRPFMRETLQLLGVPSHKLIEATPHTYLEADTLIVPSFVSRSCYTPEWVAHYMRGKFLPLISHDPSAHPRPAKIFISRQKAAYRKFTNEDQLFDHLASQGFQRYNLEELTFLEQARLFHHAHTIIAPHGAGLANLMFAKPGTQVIELFQHHEDDSYWYLSQVLKLNHTCIKTTAFTPHGGYTDTTLSPQTIQQLLASLKG